jgi:hypothetical protein
MMNFDLAEQIVETMHKKTTEELLEIWAANDRAQWSDTALEAARQTLSERNIIIPPQNAPVTSSPILEQYKGVRGWLLFFCINLTVLSPLSIIAPLGKATTSDMWHDFRPGFVIAEVLSFILAGSSIYVGVCLWRVRPGAVKRTSIFLWCMLLLNAVIALLAFTGGSLSGNDGVVYIASVIPPAVWLAYLSSSKRVKATYGPKP